MQSIVFGIPAYRERHRQIDWCLSNIRAAYPEAPVFVISDGGDDYSDVCRQHRADFRLGERLKLVRFGCQWWQRWMQAAAHYQADVSFKVDPDTCLHRPFASFPEDLDVFGSVERECDIQGGIQGFARRAVDHILASGVCLDPLYTNLDAWGNHITKGYTRWTGQISSDHTMAHIVRRLGLRCGAWSEVDSMWKKTRDFRPDVAATHPHKWRD